MTKSPVGDQATRPPLPRKPERFTLGSLAATTPTAINSTARIAPRCEKEITAVNGQPDSNAANNIAVSQVDTLSRIPPKKVILSNHTGAWCIFCPDGYVRLEEALALHGNLIGVSIHTSDDMEFPDGQVLNDVYIGGYPSGLIDIFKFSDLASVEISRVSWNTRVADRLTHVVPVSVSIPDILYDPASRQITATVRGEFFGFTDGDLRFNLWVVEDGVTGSGSGYDQANFYDTESGHPYYGAGNPIIGFVRDRTLRAMLGGTWGTEGIIPPSVSEGGIFTHQYSFVLPAGFDESRIKLIGLVSRYDVSDPENRAILNAAERSIWGIFDDDFEWGDTAAWSITTP